jgi:hypothetical protein
MLNGAQLNKHSYTVLAHKLQLRRELSAGYACGFCVDTQNKRQDFPLNYTNRYIKT